MNDRSTPPMPRLLWAALAVMTLGVFAAGGWFYHAQHAQARHSAERELQAIAALKVRQIADWRADQLGEAGELTADVRFVAEVAKWLSASEAAEAQNILRRFHFVRNHHHYADAVLVDAACQPRLSVSGRLHPLPPVAADAVSLALRSGQPTLTELHGDGEHAPHIGVVAPLWSGSGAAARPVGAVIFENEAREFLYPLVQSWPTPSPSAETLLVRCDGDEVLYLNELRHHTGTALKLRFPLGQADLPAAMVVAGQESVVAGTDYRGIPVVAALKAVPDSPWFMVAKVDAAEVFSAWRVRGALILTLMFGSVALPAVLLLALWQRNAKAHYRELYQAEVARRQSEQRHRITLRSIGDAVIATDSEGRVELLNPVAESLTGWPVGDACGKPLDEVFRIINEQTRQPVENPVDRVLREGVVVGLANHTVLVARDGSERPIADAGAPIRDTQDAITGVVLVFRDQTAERAAQQALQASLAEKTVLLSEIHHRVKNNLQIVSSLLSLQAQASPEPQVRQVLDDARRRVHAMALLHEVLYHTESPGHVNAASYLAELCTYLQRSYGLAAARVRIEQCVQPVGLPLADAVPCGLMVNELVTNALKHGFPGGRSGAITVELRPADGRRMLLRVSDDGVGLGAEPEPQQAASLGLRLVANLAGQLEGELSVERPPGGGAAFCVTFPVPHSSFNCDPTGNASSSDRDGSSACRGGNDPGGEGTPTRSPLGRG